MTESVLNLLTLLRDARMGSDDLKIRIASELLSETGMIPNTSNARYAWIERRDPGDMTCR